MKNVFGILSISVFIFFVGCTTTATTEKTSQVNGTNPKQVSTFSYNNILSDFINSVEYSYDGKSIVFSTPVLIKIIDGQTGMVIQEIFDTNIRDLKFSGNNPYLQNQMGAWGITNVRFSPDDQYVSYALYSNIKTFNINNPALIYISEGHTDMVRTFVYSPNGKYLASGSNDRNVIIWDTSKPNFHVLHTLTGHTSPVNEIKFFPNGTYIASCSSSGQIIIWDITTGTKIREIHSDDKFINSIDISPDGKYIVTGHDFPKNNKGVKIWETDTGLLYKEIQSGRTWVTTFTPDGKYLLIGTGGVSSINTIAIYDLQRDNLNVLQQDSTIHNISVRNDSKYFVVGFVRNINIWKIE